MVFVSYFVLNFLRKEGKDVFHDRLDGSLVSRQESYQQLQHRRGDLQRVRGVFQLTLVHLVQSHYSSEDLDDRFGNEIVEKFEAFVAGAFLVLFQHFHDEGEAIWIAV